LKADPREAAVSPTGPQVYIAANGEVRRALPPTFPFAGAVHRRTGLDAADSASDLTAPADGAPCARAADKPATLVDVMRATIGHGLQAHYRAPRIITHQLLVLLMQLNEARRIAEKPAPIGRARPGRRRARSPSVAVGA
jgi:hypothetical protein